MGKKLKNRKGLPMDHIKALKELTEMDEVKAENARLKAQLAEAREAIERLRAGYAEAIEDIGDWALYASDYFREKHDLRVTLLKHKTVLAGQGGGDE